MSLPSRPRPCMLHASSSRLIRSSGAVRPGGGAGERPAGGQRLGVPGAGGAGHHLPRAARDVQHRQGHGRAGESGLSAPYPSQAAAVRSGSRFSFHRCRALSERPASWPLTLGLPSRAVGTGEPAPHQRLPRGQVPGRQAAAGGGSGHHVPHREARKVALCARERSEGERDT